jgi:TRAP-type mannitol/chloroaromatic compound transport system permease small subunit
MADESIATRRSDNVADLPDDLPLKSVVIAVDTLNLWVGRITGWLIVPLILAMSYEIFMRKFFIAPTAWAYDVSRMLYGAMFILGSAYGLSKGIHIRSDFLYRNWSIKTQGAVDTFLYTFFYLPAMLIFLWVAGDWAWESVVRMERGMDTTLMPLLGPIKMCLPIGIFLLILQGISELIKSWYAMTRGAWPNHIPYDPETDPELQE